MKYFAKYVTAIFESQVHNVTQNILPGMQII